MNLRTVITSGIVGAVVAVTVSACGGTETAGSTGTTASPTVGGSATVMTSAEPRNLDPAVMGNNWSLAAVYGNAIFGTLLTSDPTTGALQPSLAEKFESTDGGKTFTLTLRSGLVFSDGTPLTVKHVEANWKHVADPLTGSGSIQSALYVATMTAVDDRNLTISLKTPVASFGQAVVASSLNWIAKADQLDGDKTRTIGAGPFVMSKWTPQDAMTLVRNSKYFDAPKPYLDQLVLRANGDGSQRLSSLVSSSADLIVDGDPQINAKAKAATIPGVGQEFNGGYNLTFNTKSASFADVRARTAVVKAIDLNALNEAVFGGKAEVPTTLIRKSSPFYSGTAQTSLDRPGAQALFDQLAAEGKPVRFTMIAVTTTSAHMQAIQAQLKTYKNVDAQVEVLEYPAFIQAMVQGRFDAISSGVMFVDPETQLWQNFDSHAKGSNYSQLSDPQMDAALDAGRASTDVAARKAAYTTVEDRLAATNPALFYSYQTIVASSRTLGGAHFSGLGSLLPAELWRLK